MDLQIMDGLSSIENIRTLTDLGLKSAQAKIYLNLLALGPTSISKLAIASQVARPDTYRYLCELQELGIVKKIVATHTEVKPLPIDQAIAILLLRKTKEHLDLDKRAKRLVGVIKKQTDKEKHAEENQFALIQGDAIDFELQRSTLESKKTVCIMGSSRQVLQGIMNHYETFQNALRRNVEIRIVTEEPRGSDPPRKIKFLQKFPGFEWRYLTDAPAVWLKIYDSQKIILTTSRNEPLNHSAVLSNNSFLVELSQNYFNSAWFSAIEPQDQKFKHDSRQFDYLFSNLTGGFAYCKMIFGDQGKPVDFVLLETNEAFIKYLKTRANFLGEHASKILSPGAWKNIMASLEKYWPTISAGKSVRFEYLSVDLEKWFSVLSYSPENGYFACIFEDITERKKAEHALIQSEANYKNLINGMNETAWVIDFNGNFIDVNAAACKTLGYSKEELLTMGLKDVDKAFNKEQFKNHLKSMPTAGGIQVFESVHTAKDGIEIPVEISSSLITYYGEQAKLSIARSIAERKKAEETLKESEIKFRTLVETTDDVVLLTDLEGRHIFRNQAYFTSLGYKIGEELSFDGYEIVHPEDAPILKAKMAQLLKLGSMTAEYRVKHKDGSWLYRFSKSKVIYNQVHEPTAIIAIIRDITERKKSEEALKESEEIFSKAFRSSPAMLTITRISDNRIIDVNDAFLNFLELTREETIGHTTKELNIIPDYDSRNKLISKALQQGRVHNYELTAQTKTGKKLELLASIEIINIHGELHLLSSLIVAAD